jgi:spermidine synthase
MLLFSHRQWRLRKARITKNYPAMRMGRGQRKIVHFFKGIGVSLARLTPVVHRRGSFGAISLFRHPELGRIFVLDDEIQHVEAWAPLYHEPLVHLPASFVERVNDVLILGGGTLYAAAEALKYNSVRRVVLVDRDPRVIETVAQYYPHARGCLKDRRFTLLHEDAYSLLPRLRNQFDLVINDGADLLDVKVGAAHGGARSNVFSVMAAALKPSGACADVVQRHVFERGRILRTLRRCGQRFRLALSLVFLPEYHGVLHVLTIWGGRASAVRQTPVRPANTEQARWARDHEQSPCVYYDPRFLRYYFYLPPYLRQVLTAKRKAV